ncbi:type III secretion system translocon subunit VopD [Vibrio sp. NH-UV-68]|uniref:type III secretion system translocon subunit VopD n=1 Tax=unclassified Vibrio TaxID=2614977 RepID=UPI0036F40C79
MVDLISNTKSTANIYALGQEVKITVKAQQAATKTEASAVKGTSNNSAPLSACVQLDVPKTLATSHQGKVAEKLVDAVAPTLNLLTQTLDKTIKGQPMVKSVSESVSQVLSLLSLLYQVSKLSRNQQTLQREIAVEANVASLQYQANEMKNAANALLATAVVSGVLAGATAATGVVGNIKAVGKIKAQVADNHALKPQKAGLEQVEQMLKSKNLSAAQKEQLVKLHNTGQDNIADMLSKRQVNSRKFEHRMAKNQANNAVLQALGQMSNAASNVEQTKAQARGKEDEILAARAQAAKQKADENLGFQDSLLKELRELFRAISDSENQAWRASGSAV